MKKNMIHNDNDLLLADLSKILLELVTEDEKISDDLDNLYFVYKEKCPDDEYGIRILRNIIFSDLPLDTEILQSAIQYFESKTQEKDQ